MRKKDETLRQVLLDCAREQVDREGVESLHIRDIAARAGVASGTVYHYFAHKEALLLALTKEYWEGALKNMAGQLQGGHFLEDLTILHRLLSARVEGKAGELMRALHSTPLEGRGEMQSMQQGLDHLLAASLARDPALASGPLAQEVPQKQFLRFVRQNLLLSLGQQEAFDFFLEVVGAFLRTSQKLLPEK